MLPTQKILLPHSEAFRSLLDIVFIEHIAQIGMLAIVSRAELAGWIALFGSTADYIKGPTPSDEK